jgi:hypothetical protein
MASQGTFKFDKGDRVVIFDATPDNRRAGAVTGRYGRFDDIPRQHDTVLATSPWPELMYTIKLDDGKEPAELIQQESGLKLLADIPAESLKYLRPPQG